MCRLSGAGSSYALLAMQIVEHWPEVLLKVIKSSVWVFTAKRLYLVLPNLGAGPSILGV